MRTLILAGALLLPAPQDDVERKLAELQPKIDDAIDRGVDWLVQMQARDGSWAFQEWATWKSRIGQTALAVYTLLKSGLPPEHFAVRRGLIYLREETDEVTFTYDAACLILAFEAAGDKGDRKHRALRVHREGLRRRLGLRERRGGHRLHDRRRVTCLAICRQALEKKIDVKVRDAIKRDEEKGLHWLGSQWTAKTNPKRTGVIYRYYWLYGVERVGSILGVERLWYLEGAQELLARQGKDGHWADINAEADTCFALLFLKRATRWLRSGEPAQKKRARAYAAKDGDLLIEAQGYDTLDAWVAGFSGAVKEKHGDPPRVAKVEWRVDGRTVKEVPGDAKTAWPYPAKLTFPSRGRHRVDARPHVLAADAPPDAKPAAVIESKEMAVEVPGVWEEWMQRCAEGRRRNLLTGRSVTATATSTNIDYQAPAFAADGRQTTYWVSKKEDAAPAITLEIAPPATAKFLSLASCNNRLETEGGHDRVTKVEIRINGGKAFAAGVRPVEVKVVDRAPGKKWPGCCGFSEIGLEAGR